MYDEEIIYPYINRLLTGVGVIEEEYDHLHEGLNSIKNPYQSWAKPIFEKSKNMKRNGTRINAMFLSSLILLLNKC